MSQSSRSKVRARRRHREQVARLIADSQLSERVICGLCSGLGFTDDECPCPSHVLRGVEHVHHVEPDCAAVCKLCEGTGSGRRVLARALLSDPEQGFDVHAARELGERLVSDGDALELERVPFVDWCMSRGLGPDNRERGAFVALGCLYCPTPGSIKGAAACRRACDCGYGGFPGKLAREWQRMGGRRNVAHGAELRRMGQRLLDAIAGQASECQSGCFGSGQRTAFAKSTEAQALSRPGVVRASVCEVMPGFHEWIEQCPDCHGTGHNIAGVLPGLVWSAQDVRKAADGYEPGGGPWIETHARQLAVLNNCSQPMTCDGPALATVDGETADTRTVPRGEHRLPLTGLVAVRLMSALRRAGRELPSVDLRINGRGDDFAEQRRAANS